MNWNKGESRNLKIPTYLDPSRAESFTTYHFKEIEVLYDSSPEGTPFYV